MYDQLCLILNRILPLRKSDGAKDILVCLGDYIDRRKDSHKVVDLLMEVRDTFPGQVFLVQGNHERMLLDAAKPSLESSKFLFWMRNGGEQTIFGYLDRAGQPMDNPYTIPRIRLMTFVPNNHIAFFNSLLPFYETDEFIFVHGGCNPQLPLKEQEVEEMVFDMSLWNYVQNRPDPLPWEKKIVTGHNGRFGAQTPLIRDKFLMLDTSAYDKLMVTELRSMKACSVKVGKKRLFELDFSKKE
jgi:serine/threonine protein phosphatase 1